MQSGQGQSPETHLNGFITSLSPFTPIGTILHVFFGLSLLNPISIGVEISACAIAYCTGYYLKKREKERIHETLHQLFDTWAYIKMVDGIQERELKNNLLPPDYAALLKAPQAGLSAQTPNPDLSFDEKIMNAYSKLTKKFNYSDYVKCPSQFYWKALAYAALYLAASETAPFIVLTFVFQQKLYNELVTTLLILGGWALLLSIPFYNLALSDYTKTQSLKDMKANGSKFLTSAIRKMSDKNDVIDDCLDQRARQAKSTEPKAAAPMRDEKTTPMEDSVAQVIVNLAQASGFEEIEALRELIQERQLGKFSFGQALDEKLEQAATQTQKKPKRKKPDGEEVSEMSQSIRTGGREGQPKLLSSRRSSVLSPQSGDTMQQPLIARTFGS